MDLSSIHHDDDLWGVAYSKEEEPRELVRLSEVVKHFVDRKTPLLLAATKVLSVLEAVPPSRWFLLENGWRAAAADERDIWLEPGTFGEGLGQDGLPDWRHGWRRIDRSDSWFYFDRDEDEIEIEVYAMRGTRGLLLCLSRSLLESRSIADLDEVGVLANRVAILESDALRLFAGPSALVVTSAKLNELPRVQSMKGKWTDEEVKRVVSDYKQAMSEGHKAEGAKEAVAKLWGKSSSTIRDLLRRARKLEPRRAQQAVGSR